MLSDMQECLGWRVEGPSHPQESSGWVLLQASLVCGVTALSSTIREHCPVSCVVTIPIVFNGSCLPLTESDSIWEYVETQEQQHMCRQDVLHCTSQQIEAFMQAAVTCTQI